MLDKRGRSCTFLLGGLLLAYFLAKLFVSNPGIAFLLQFLIALIGVSLLITYAMQAFSLAKWKRMLALSLLIISALTWYVYPGLRTGTSTPVVTSYQELVERSDVIVIGHYSNKVRTWQLTRSGFCYKTGTSYEITFLSDTRLIAILSRRPYFQGGPKERHDYLFNAEQYLKGDEGQNFVVSLPYKYLDTDTMAADYIEPPLGEKVVLFFSSIREDWNDPDTEPYMFKLVDDTLYVQSNFSWVRKTFPPITLTELMKMIGD